MVDIRRWSVWCLAAAVLLWGGCSGDDPVRSGGGNLGGSSGAGGLGGVGGGGPMAGVGPTGGVGAVGGTSGTDGDPNSCGEVSITPIVEYTPGNLLIIFDRSFSMSNAFGMTNRIEAAKKAVTDALTPLRCPDLIDPDGPGCQETLAVGAVMFPSKGPNGETGSPSNLLCNVESIVTDEQIGWLPVSQFLDTWPQYWPNHQLLVGTPIGNAFFWGNDALTIAPPGTSAVLFITDGDETCSGVGSDPVATTQQWATTGIETHVVSLATDNTGAGRAFNDQIAAAGGTGMSLNPTDANTLSAQIQSIVKSASNVGSCEIVLDGGRIINQAGACELGMVTLGPTKIACDQDAKQEGFYIQDESTMVLVGGACDLLMTGNPLAADFPCNVVGPS